MPHRTGRYTMAEIGKQIAKCDSKVAFHTLVAACAAADLGRRHRGIVLHAYRCPICGDWHLTSQA